MKRLLLIVLFSDRYYMVQYRGDSSGPWQTVNERVEPTVTSYTVHGLKPFTAYQFRIQVIFTLLSNCFIGLIIIY